MLFVARFLIRRVFEDDPCHVRGEEPGYEDKGRSTAEVIKRAVKKPHERRAVQE